MHRYLENMAIVAVVTFLPAATFSQDLHPPGTGSRVDGASGANAYDHGIRSTDGLPRHQSAFPGMPPVDKDDNGIVSSDEAAAYFRRYFAIIDADKNGELTLPEFPLVFDGPGPAMIGVADERARWEKRRAARFAAIDGNDDGIVTREEFQTFGDSEFQASDRNGNGEVTVWEFVARRHD